MKVTLKIQRFDPEVDAKPHWKEYEVDVEPTDRLLDALHQVSSGTRTAPWPSAVPAPTACAAPTP